jgi:hypothetical protein
MRPIGCSETSIRNYHSGVRDIPRERISHNFGVLEVRYLLSTETTMLLQSGPEIFFFVFTVRHFIPIRYWRGPVLFCWEPRRYYRKTVLYCHVFESKVCYLFKFHWLSHKPRKEEDLPYIRVQELALERSLVPISARVLNSLKYVSWVSSFLPGKFWHATLTLILLTWSIRWNHNNASRWQMGFNSSFKRLK